MALSHTVEQGEFLSKIALNYGIDDYRLIWNHPENVVLKTKRKNPNILLPGDSLFIPDAQHKEAAILTGNRHHFRLISMQLKIRFKLNDVSARALADKACDLEIEGVKSQLTSDAEGLLEQTIRATDENAQLLIVEQDKHIRIHIGHLDPIEERTGQVARLNNLGYGGGHMSGQDEGQYLMAVEEFQCDHNLKVDGICGDRTQAKLVEIHGC